MTRNTDCGKQAFTKGVAMLFALVTSLAGGALTDAHAQSWGYVSFSAFNCVEQWTQAGGPRIAPSGSKGLFGASTAGAAEVYCPINIAELYQSNVLNYRDASVYISVTATDSNPNDYFQCAVFYDGGEVVSFNPANGAVSFNWGYSGWKKLGATAAWTGAADSVKNCPQMCLADTNQLVIKVTPSSEKRENMYMVCRIPAKTSSGAVSYFNSYAVSSGTCIE